MSKALSIAILAQDESPNIAALCDTISNRGHEPILIFYQKCDIACDLTGSHLYVEGQKFTRQVDGVMLRSWGVQVPLGEEVQRHFESTGAVPSNPVLSVHLSNDKWASLQRLASYGVPVPPSYLITQSARLFPVIEQLGGFPLVLKALRGTWGKAVHQIDNAEQAETLFDQYQNMGLAVLLQKFVAANDADHRLVVVDGNMVANVMRVAPPGSFKANVSGGGHAEKYTASPQMCELAVKASQAMGHRVSGVDIMIDHTTGQLYVGEVNDGPDLI
ncbi:RimK family alpha-L-glutamate ligase, partial [bacterium]|nr:RimK family alpha-L-glutamate ligase [bacterium]